MRRGGSRQYPLGDILSRSEATSRPRPASGTRSMATRHRRARSSGGETGVAAGAHDDLPALLVDRFGPAGNCGDESEAGIGGLQVAPVPVHRG